LAGTVRRVHGPHVDDLDDFLSPLPPGRGASVKAWLESSLGDCPVCTAPVRVIDPHDLIKAGIAHRACATTSDP
jgi:hypothetical protein